MNQVKTQGSTTVPLPHPALPVARQPDKLVEPAPTAVTPASDLPIHTAHAIHSHREYTPKYPLDGHAQVSLRTPPIVTPVISRATRTTNPVSQASQHYCIAGIAERVIATLNSSMQSMIPSTYNIQKTECDTSVRTNNAGTRTHVPGSKHRTQQRKIGIRNNPRVTILSGRRAPSYTYEKPTTRV